MRGYSLGRFCRFPAVLPVAALVDAAAVLFFRGEVCSVALGEDKAGAVPPRRAPPPKLKNHAED